MHWFVWFSFLTVPALVGVAFTLSSSSSGDFRGPKAVVTVGACWLLLAYLARKYLAEHYPKRWVRRWVFLCVFLPLVGLFAKALCRDPEIIAVFQRHAERSDHRDLDTVAEAAPARHALSWSEVRELLALMQPRAARYSLQLFTSLPLAWWLAAFSVAVWRGK